MARSQGLIERNFLSKLSPVEVRWGRAGGTVPPSSTASWRGLTAYSFFREEMRGSYEKDNYNEKGSNE
jgi:hypothetical protein